MIVDPALAAAEATAYDEKRAPPSPTSTISSMSSASDSPPPYVDSGTSGPDADALGAGLGLDRLYIETKHRSVSGTYRIAAAPRASPESLPVYAGRRKYYPRGHRHHHHRHHGHRRCRHPDDEPNAVFRSRHGALDLKLAMVGDAGVPTRANVHVTTRGGDITLDLFELQPDKRINLEAYSRRGDITLLVPPAFRGALQLRARHGSLTLLPALAHSARAVTSTSTEALLLLGGAQSPLGQPIGGEHEQVLDDFCQLMARSGNLTIGLSGADMLPERPVGLWKQLVDGVFGGKKASSAN